MLFYNLDMIVRRWLLERNLPIHYYAEALYHGSSALRELSKDTLQLVNTVRLGLNDYGACDLPADFVEEVSVGVPIGEKLQPVVKAIGLNPLRYRDESGAFAAYPTPAAGNPTGYFPTAWTWFFNVNEFGEPTGRLFGTGGGAKSNGYQVFRERREIQFTGTFTSTEAVLTYVSDGQRADNASQVDTRAVRAIHSWIDWQCSPNAAFKDSGEARTYYNEKRLLRANLNDITLEDIKQAFYKAYRGTLKN